MTLYHKVKLELYAENMQAEGLVSRLTLFLDRARTLVKERREAFKNRVDRLDKRVHYPGERKVRDKTQLLLRLRLKEGQRRGQGWSCMSCDS